MIRLLAAVGATALLAACATDNSPQGVCARRAYDDPTVSHLIMVGAGSPALQIEDQERLKRAKRAATNKCLADMGVIRQGGVEMPLPYD